MVLFIENRIMPIEIEKKILVLSLKEEKKRNTVKYFKYL
jgi:hypothetical protein